MNLYFPKISIITVVYNHKLQFQKTINEIVNIDYPNFEYIVIDGGSTDGTMELLKQYENKITKYISEPDNGLYDAMNKGISFASGEYLWFINAGDLPFNRNILKNVFTENQEFADFYYGQTNIIDNIGNTLRTRRLKAPQVLNWKSFKKGMLVCHQSMIIKKEKVPNFDLTYRYSADFDWAIKCLKASGKITNTHLTISKFLEGGKTRKTLIPGLLERFRIMVIHYGFLTTLFNHIFICGRLLFHIIKK